ncbi:MAG: hypothetical protein U0X34_02910 [Bacteroidia bacterium]
MAKKSTAVLGQVQGDDLSRVRSRECDPAFIIGGIQERGDKKTSPEIIRFAGEDAAAGSGFGIWIPSSGAAQAPDLCANGLAFMDPSDGDCRNCLPSGLRGEQYRVLCSSF